MRRTVEDFLISSHDLNANLVIIAVTPKAQLLFQQTKEWPPLALVIAEQNCHRPVIIKEPSIFQHLRAYVNFANPCTFTLFLSAFGETRTLLQGGNALSHHTWPGVWEYPTGAVQFLLRPIKHTYGWE